MIDDSGDCGGSSVIVSFVRLETVTDDDDVPLSSWHERKTTKHVPDCCCVDVAGDVLLMKKAMVYLETEVLGSRAAAAAAAAADVVVGGRDDECGGD
jgi:hypothetical protein